MGGRRGQGRAAASAEADESHNTLQSHEDSDPIKGVIRFGMETLKKVINDTIPYCPADNDEMKREIADRMEANFLQLVQAELIHEKTDTFVNQVVEELALQDNPDMDAKEFVDALDSMNVLVEQRVAAYKQTLTENVLRGHRKFATMKAQLDSLLSAGPDSSDDVADAETEAEEVDLDDSVMDDDDDDEHEVIPDLDPITKQPLEDPCRNTICRHIYGKSSMLQLIKKNPKTRCPAMGCDNANFVKASHLIDDPVLTAKVTGQPLPPKMSKQSPKPGTSPRARRGGRRRR